MAGHIDVQFEQVTDRVAVLRAIEPVKGLGPSGIGIRRCSTIERRLQVRDKALVTRLIGAPPALRRRRHGARVQFPQGLFPDQRVRGHVVDVRHVEGNSSGRTRQFRVVTTHAVLLDEGSLLRVNLSGRCGRGRRLLN